MNVKKQAALLLIFILPILFGCTGFSGTDEEIILEMYAQIVLSYSREDLYGVMKYVSKDFTSDIEDQKTYDEVREYRKSFILRNRNVSIGFRNINMTIDNSKAEVTYEVHVDTNRLNDRWKQSDTLMKKRGKWEIVSTKLVE